MSDAIRKTKRVQHYAQNSDSFGFFRREKGSREKGSEKRGKTPLSGFHHRLVDDVDFCFTDTMNGCTFAVGSGTNPLISHYNFADSNTQLIDQAKIDRHVARRYKYGVTTLKKADYKRGEGMDQRVTMIGIRSDGAWRFYYQRRADDLRFVPGKGSELVQIALDQSVRLT